jgi:YkoY family integral membrane protein
MEIIQTIFGTDPKAALFIILNLILIESLLSIDNAAVLATMVMDLEEKQRSKALKYGIFGAYFFRGLCLIFAAILVKILWLKALGGLYLCWLALKFFTSKINEAKNQLVEAPEDNNDETSKETNPIYKFSLGLLGPFWSTVLLVEIMDLAFSIDNVFAAVAFTNKIWLICIGVFIGILAMRYAAQAFVNLLTKFPFLENSAYAVIGILGLKLINSYTCDLLIPSHGESSFVEIHNQALSNVCHVLNGHNADFITSLLTISIFAVPLLTSWLFNVPRKKQAI